MPEDALDAGSYSRATRWLRKTILETGNLVGDAAMGCYGDCVEMPFDSADYAGTLG